MSMREFTDDPTTWTEEDFDEEQEPIYPLTVSTATASLARYRKRLKDTASECAQAREQGLPLTPGLLQRVLDRTIQHSQVYEASIHTEVAAANTGARRDIYVMRRQTAASERSAYVAAEKAQGAADRAHVASVAALDALVEAKSMEDRAVARAERAGLYHLRQVREEARQAERWAMLGVAMGVLGIFAGLFL